jgi:hypothetical protein
MTMKVTIQSWNGNWRYDIEDEDGEEIDSGILDSFTGCFARCLDVVSKWEREAK